VNGIIDLLYTPLGITSNYRAIAYLHNSQIITVFAKPSLTFYVLTSRYLATVYNSGDFSASHVQVLSSQRPV
jgi:hypothetical protein